MRPERTEQIEIGQQSYGTGPTGTQMPLKGPERDLAGSS